MGIYKMSEEIELKFYIDSTDNVELISDTVENALKDYQIAKRMGEAAAKAAMKEGKSPYYAYYFDSFSTEQTPNEEREYWWLDEIENDSLYKAIMKLTPKRRELVQLLVFDGYSQVDAAEKLGISQGTVWNQWEKIVNLLKETVNV